MPKLATVEWGTRRGDLSFEVTAVSGEVKCNDFGNDSGGNLLYTRACSTNKYIEVHHNILRCLWWREEKGHFQVRSYSSVKEGGKVVTY